jgi:uncharacterized protein YfdQ (DUF2303 family)
MSYQDQTTNTSLNGVEAALLAGAALGEPRSPSIEPGAGTYAVVPKNCHVTDLAEYMPQPLRIKEDVALYDAESFISYVNTFKDASSRLFFDPEDESFQAALDYHLPGVPSWGTHSAEFKPRRSVEFQTWLGKNRVQMTQVDFARFLEENLPDIVEPSNSELLQVALSFEAKKSADFSSGIRLANGQIQFQYDEVIRGSANKGTLEVPEQFVLGITIHLNGPAYKIPVRLRWRLQESKVVFWYEIVRPHKFVEDALKEIQLRVADQTALPLLSGDVK